MDKKWIEHYKSAEDSINSRREEQKGVILGFNVNTDHIIQLTEKEWNDLIKEKNVLAGFRPQKTLAVDIRNKNDFLNSLLNSLKSGKADEKIIANEEVNNWIKETFNVNTIKIGGQAGIIAELFATIGVKNVLLSLPNKSEIFKRFFSNEITVAEERDEFCILSSIHNLKSNSETDLPHYIFEFRKGNYNFGEGSIHCFRDNRFIASFDSVNSKIAISDCFKKISVEYINDYKLAIISGYHLAQNEERSYNFFNNLFEPSKKLLESWKKYNEKLILHLELAAIDSNELKQALINTIIPVIDSIGLNEQELLSIIRLIDKGLAKTLEQNFSIITIFQVLLKLHSTYSHLRIHLHFLGYYLVISNPLSRQELEKRRTSLLIASIFASIRAKEGVINFDKRVSIDLTVISDKGYNEIKLLNNYIKEQSDVIGCLKQEGYISTTEYSIVVIPTLLVDLPKHLVGLGDTISSIALLFETP